MNIKFAKFNAKFYLCAWEDNVEEANKGNSASILILALSILQTDSGYSIKMICIPKVRRNLSPQKVLGRGSLASNYKALIHAPRQ